MRAWCCQCPLLPQQGLEFSADSLKRLACAPNSERAFARRGIDDATALNHLRFTGGDEPSRRRTRWFHQRLPLVRIDQPSCFAGTDRGVAGTIAEQCEDRSFQGLVGRSNTAPAASIRAVAHLVPVRCPCGTPSHGATARGTRFRGRVHGPHDSDALDRLFRADASCEKSRPQLLTTSVHMVAPKVQRARERRVREFGNNSCLGLNDTGHLRWCIRSLRTGRLVAGPCMLPGRMTHEGVTDGCTRTR